MTFTLSGFADEISPEPGVQLETLAAESIRYLELRSAWSANVATMTDAQLANFQREIEDAGVRVSAIGSPIGKIDVGDPLGPELERMRRIADVAGRFGTPIVRVFSFFMPTGEPPERYRESVIDRMGALAEIAAERGIVLAHENEKEIYGDIPERCADLITSVGSPALRATFDAANFVQCGVRPHTDAYQLLRPHLVYLQVRSCRPGRATARCARRWPRWRPRAFPGTRRWSRTWPRRAATEDSAARRSSAGPPPHSKTCCASCPSPGSRPGHGMILVRTSVVGATPRCPSSRR
jgi:sugar phosphate isomerase/epimerase